MSSYYQTKSDIHYKQWQDALSLGKPIVADYHRQEYLNYQKLLNQYNDL